MEENIDYFNRLNDQNNAIMIQNIQYLRQLRNIEMTRKYKVFPRIDPFSRYDDIEFLRRYRMSKRLFDQLFDMLDGVNTLNPLVCPFMVLILDMCKLNRNNKCKNDDIHVVKYHSIQ